MKIGIVDNNFVMQSFGVGRNVKKLSDKKTKYTNIGSQVLNRTSQVVNQTVAQTLKIQHETCSQKSQLQTKQNKPQNTDNYNQQISKPKFVSDEEKLAQLRIIENKLLQNEKIYFSKKNLYTKWLNERSVKQEQIISYLMSTSIIFEKMEKQSALIGILKQINEILDSHKYFYQENLIPYNSYYYNIISNNKKLNPSYELSKSSLYDNSKLLEVSKKSIVVIESIIEKTDVKKSKKNIEDIIPIFGVMATQTLADSFERLKNIFEFYYAIVKEEILYRQSCINLISGAIMIENNQSVLFQFDSTSSPFESKSDNSKIAPSLTHAKPSENQNSTPNTTVSKKDEMPQPQTNLASAPSGYESDDDSIMLPLTEFEFDLNDNF